MPDHIYLSPHLDDAVFSCGGVIYQQTSQGEEVFIITICAGDPETDHLSAFAQSLHKRWGIDHASVMDRREEDLLACERVGARALHLPIPEAIYRLGKGGTPLYTSEESIFGDLHPSEGDLPDRIADLLVSLLAGMQVEIGDENVRVYVPIGYGGHVDHILLREAVNRLEINTFFYRDFPYAMRGNEISSEYRVFSEEEIRIQLSDQEIRIWSTAVKDYKSQLSTFWMDDQMIEAELKSTHDQMGGIPFIYYRQRSNHDGKYHNLCN